MYLLLWIPVSLYINTHKNEYKLTIQNIATASLQNDIEHLIRIKLSVLFWKFYFYPFKENISYKYKARGKVVTSKSTSIIRFDKVLKMLRSFKLKKLLLDIDTGDCITNVKLFVFFRSIKSFIKGTFEINFEGNNQFELHMENRGIFLLTSLIS
ncbi:hypothetical protein [Aquimarina sp. 2-A2]|uniref:hypothetical protein n=1 Tax=Aquimarina sp. 2-A2 TaxID=3382644 RepID=UPI00388F375C